MPELPEVESLRLHLSPLIEGQVVTEVKVFLPRIVRQGEIRQSLGSRIGPLRRRGKWLIIPTDKSYSFFFHLGMTGTLRYGEYSVMCDAQPDHLRLALGLEKGWLEFWDTRTLGGVWWAEKPPWKDLGPDPLLDRPRFREFQQALVGRKAPIKALLHDQRIVAGIGNIYAAEALFRTRIHPLRPGGELSEEEVIRLWREMRRVAKEAIAHAGTTFRDWRLSDGREGGFQKFLKVYGKQGLPCPRCRVPIQRVKLQGRSTYFCPQCQR